MGPGRHGAHLGPTGPRWAPCWPHEHCYRGIFRVGPPFIYAINSQYFNSFFLNKIHTKKRFRRLMGRPSCFQSRHNVLRNPCSYLRHHVISDGDIVDMSPWWPLLGLLSWCPIFKSSHCNSFEVRVPELQMSCSDSTSWQGSRIIVPSMVTGDIYHPPLIASNLSLYTHCTDLS